jgi:DNA-binding response OmpR family regulator
MAERARETILLVEDDRAMTRIVSAALKARGFKVVAAPTGKAALASAQRDNPAVVLLDLGLPDIDGYEVGRRIRALPNGARTRLIALTGYGQTEDRRRTAEAGFDAHLTKPVNVPALEAMFS